MLALDSLSLPFVRSHLNRLPVFDRLIEQGSLRLLGSSGDFASESVWPSFCLGAHPGAHGQYFPFQWDARTMSFRRPVRGRWAQSFHFDPFWFALARKGFNVAVFDVGQIGHQSNVPCVQIVNWSHQVSGLAFSNPPELLAKIRSRFGYRPIGCEVPVPKGRRQCNAIRDSLLRAVKVKADAIIWLAETQDWQFLLAGMYELHRAGHNLWPIKGEFASDAAPDAMLDVYIEVDRQLVRILNAINLASTAVVIFALNGMEANRAQNHFLHEILNRLNAVYLSRVGKTRARAQRFNVIGGLRKTLPYDLQSWAARLMGENVQDWVVNKTLTRSLDWATTPAFALSTGGEGFIRLNLRGRERLGCLEPEEADGFVRWLKSELARVTVVGSDEPLVAEIIDVRKRFPGPRADLLPDLSIRWAPRQPEKRIHSPTIGQIVAKLETGRSGNHSPDSFALFCGTAAQDRVLSQVTYIEDLSRLPDYWLNMRKRTPLPLTGIERQGRPT
jgi:predicted AlkP superfamily phosphohydrolase/phosphomutase